MPSEENNNMEDIVNQNGEILENLYQEPNIQDNVDNGKDDECISDYVFVLKRRLTPVRMEITKFLNVLTSSLNSVDYNAPGTRRSCYDLNWLKGDMPDERACFQMDESEISSKFFETSNLPSDCKSHESTELEPIEIDFMYMLHCSQAFVNVRITVPDSKALDCAHEEHWVDILYGCPSQFIGIGKISEGSEEGIEHNFEAVPHENEETYGDTVSDRVTGEKSKPEKPASHYERVLKRELEKLFTYFPKLLEIYISAETSQDDDDCFNQLRPEATGSGRSYELRPEATGSVRSYELRPEATGSGRSYELRPEATGSGRSYELRPEATGSGRSYEHCLPRDDHDYAVSVCGRMQTYEKINFLPHRGLTADVDLRWPMSFETGGRTFLYVVHYPELFVPSPVTKLKRDVRCRICKELLITILKTSGETDVRTESTSEDVTEVGPEDVGENVCNTGTESTSEDVTELGPEDVGENVCNTGTESTSVDVTEVGPEDVDENVCNTGTESTSVDVTEVGPEDAGENVYNTGTESTSEDVTEVGPEDVGENVCNTGTESTSEDVTEVGPEDAGENVCNTGTESTSEDVTEVGPEDVDENVCNTGTESTSEDVTEVGPEDVGENVCNTGTESTSVDVTEVGPEDVGENVCNTGTESTSVDVTEVGPEDVGENVCNTGTESTSVDVTEVGPEDVGENVCNTGTESTSEDVTEVGPENVDENVCNTGTESTSVDVTEVGPEDVGENVCNTGIQWK